jgi:hypothetical protein
MISPKAILEKLTKTDPGEQLADEISFTINFFNGSRDLDRLRSLSRKLGFNPKAIKIRALFCRTTGSTPKATL